MDKAIRLLVVFLSTMLIGCASVIKGYYDTVEIINSPNDLKIRTIDGVDIPIQTLKRKEPVYNDYGEYAGIDTTIITKRIKLRSSRDHVLVLSFSNKELRYEANKKLGLGWFLVDVIFGGFGAAYDYLTGNWHYFDDIEFK